MEIIKIDMTDKRYPQKLLKIKAPPSEIYATGNVELLNSKFTLGIVGTRNCSEYGRRVTNDFSKKIADSGVCIISGLAIGIDGIAHNAAIEKKGKTIAVLGTGLANIYPKENEWLFYKIIQNGGCVISEYPLETIPDKNRFPIRNRIISGLSDALLVVEASHRSGSSITAKYARQEKKDIYAIPNTIYATEGIGTNRLIKDGAILVTKPEEILERYGLKNNKSINSKEIITNKEDNKERTRKNLVKNKNKEYKIDKFVDIRHNQEKDRILPNEYLEVYKILSNQPIHINEISKKLSKAVSEIIPIITILEIDGYVYQSMNNYFMKNI